MRRGRLAAVAAARDKALAVIEAARRLEIVDHGETALLAVELQAVAKAVKEYDWEEIPF